MYKAMAGVHGLGLAVTAASVPLYVYGVALLALFAALALPNLERWMYRARPALSTPGYPETDMTAPAGPWPTWKPSPAWAVIAGLLLAACALKLNDLSEFIYFQF
jgi:hypothetical protein